MNTKQNIALWGVIVAAVGVIVTVILHFLPPNTPDEDFGTRREAYSSFMGHFRRLVTCAIEKDPLFNDCCEELQNSFYSIEAFLKPARRKVHRAEMLDYIRYCRDIYLDKQEGANHKKEFRDYEEHFEKELAGDLFDKSQ
jgi:hypothetical protein